MQNVIRGFRIALLQFKVGMNKVDNIQHACQYIRNAVIENAPKVVALPECFNSPYGTKYFNEYSEIIPTGETSISLSNIAKELGIYVIGGTIPERDEHTNVLYNTCTVWSPSGNLIAKHRKVHLFDIDIEGGVKFKESDVLSAGNEFTVIEINNVKIGIGICYDIRFEEMSRIYRSKYLCDMLIFPAAFNMNTGPLHWELLQRSRANDNQLYVAAISPARDINADYIAWGHSMIVDPWAKVLKQANENEAIIFADIDLNVVTQVRSQIPVFSQRRTDLYETIIKN